MQPETHVFKKKGNEQQFNFNRKVIKRSSAAVKALESGNIDKAKEELNEGISLLNKRQKIIKLADKSEFGWATVQEYVCDDLADDVAVASKIKKAEKGAASKLKTLQEKKRKSSAKFSSSTPSLSNASRIGGASGSFPPAGNYFRPQGRFSGISLRGFDLCFDVEREVTGPALVPSEKHSYHQDENHNFWDLDQCEFDQSEQEVEESACIQGKLSANFPFLA